MNKDPNNVNLTIVIFGITGDLVKNKVFKAIGEWKENNTFGIQKILNPNSQLNIVGVGRREISESDFKDFVEDTKADKSIYVEGNFDDVNTFTKLKEAILSLKTERVIIYIALPPKIVCEVVRNLSLSNVLEKSTVWPKLLLEKPFGESSESALELQNVLLDVIMPHQLFIIDHYLHKDIISRRRSSMSLIPELHPFYDDLSCGSRWKSINIYFHETKNVETRGAFYDNVGVLSDVVQNHVIQMLTVLFSEQFIVKLLKDLEISPDIVFGQYEGYLNHNGVKADSKTETYAEFTVQTSRGPITFSAGKGMEKDRISVVLQNDSRTYEWLVKDGEVSPYAHIFADAVSGTHQSFASFDAVYLGWKLVETVKKQWEKEGAKIKKIC